MAKVTDKIGQIVDQIKTSRQLEKCVNRLVGRTNKQQIEFSVGKTSEGECEEIRYAAECRRSKPQRDAGDCNLKWDCS